MNKQETSKILAIIGEVERREITPFTVEVWHEVIGRLPYAVAERSLKLVLRSTPHIIKPAHILDHAKDARTQLARERIKREHGILPGARKQVGS